MGLVKYVFGESVGIEDGDVITFFESTLPKTIGKVSKIGDLDKSISSVQAQVTYH